MVFYIARRLFTAHLQVCIYCGLEIWLEFMKVYETQSVLQSPLGVGDMTKILYLDMSNFISQ